MWELQSGGRRTAVSKVRIRIVNKLVKENGMTLSEVARNVGVTTSAIFNILQRQK